MIERRNFLGKMIITEEELDQSIFQFGHSKEGVKGEEEKNKDFRPSSLSRRLH